MAKEKEYELLSAYVKLLPSMRGFTGEVAKELGKSTSDIESAFNRTFKNLSSQSSNMFSGVGEGLKNAVKGAASSITSTISGAMRAGADVLVDTVKLGASAAGGALMAGIGAVGSEVVGGGLTRALGINQAEAKLQALGYTAGELEKIMDNASASIDGTAYGMDEAVQSSTQFLAAGIAPGEELEKSLKAVGKLADISGRSFGEMGAIMSKNASSGIVQWTDLVQIMNAGIPIQDYLAKSLNKSTAEIRKMASAGEISYQAFAQAIEDIEFDSVLFATKDISKAFSNVRAQLKKAGATMWKPILDGMGPVFNNIRAILKDLQDSEIFKEFISGWTNLVDKRLGKIGKVVKNVSKDFKSVDYMDSQMKKVTNAFKSIEGMEGPLLGLAAGLSGTLLSQLPIIGGMFSRLTVPVGLVGGALFQTYKNSELLQGALKEFKKSIKGVLNIDVGFNKGFFKNIGDIIGRVINTINDSISKIREADINFNFGGIITSIVNEFGRFIETIAPQVLPMLDRVSRIFQKLFEGFTMTLKGSDSSVGEMIGEALIRVLDIALTLAETAAPLIGAIAQAVSQIITSDAFGKLVDFLVGMINSIVSNEALFTTFISVGGALFVAGKLFGPITALVSFLTGAGGMAATAIGGAAAIGTGISAFATSMGAAGSAMLKALPGILKGIAALGIVLTAIGGLYMLLDWLGIVDAIKKLGTDLSEGFYILVDDVGYALKEVVDVLEHLLEALFSVVENSKEAITFLKDTVLDIIEGVIGAIAEGIAGIIDSVANLTETAFTGFTTLASTLAVDGVDAGIGATVLGGGLVALAAGLLALTAGNLLQDVGTGLGNLWVGLTNWMTGADSDPAGDIGGFISKIVDGAEIIETLPERWETIGEEVYQLGMQIPVKMAEGIESNYDVIYTSLLQIMDNILNSLQDYLDVRPLTIRTEMDTATPRGGDGANFRGGGTTNNSTTNFNVNTQNTSFIRSLIYAAR